MTDIQQTTIDVVREFLELAFNRREPETAVTRYVSERFRAHDPRVADGDEPLVAFLYGITTAFPALRYEPIEQAADGDLVVARGRFRRSGADAGLAAMSVFRIEEGRIVEHWGCFGDEPEEIRPDASHGGSHLAIAPSAVAS